MSKITLRQQIAIVLSLTVVSREGNRTRYKAIPLLPLTGLIFHIWPLFHSIPAKDLFYLAQSFQMAAWVIWNGMTIVTKSLWWGVMC